MAKRTKPKLTKAGAERQKAAVEKRDSLIDAGTAFNPKKLSQGGIDRAVGNARRQGNSAVASAIGNRASGTARAPRRGALSFR